MLTIQRFGINIFTDRVGTLFPNFVQLKRIDKDNLSILFITFVSAKTHY